MQRDRDIQRKMHLETDIQRYIQRATGSGGEGNRDAIDTYQETKIQPSRNIHTTQRDSQGDRARERE